MDEFPREAGIRFEWLPAAFYKGLEPAGANFCEDESSLHVPHPDISRV
jgi:hypothetical protein